MLALDDEARDAVAQLGRQVDRDPCRALAGFELTDAARQHGAVLGRRLDMDRPAGGALGPLDGRHQRVAFGDRRAQQERLPDFGVGHDAQMAELAERVGEGLGRFAGETVAQPHDRRVGRDLRRGERLQTRLMVGRPGLRLQRLDGLARVGGAQQLG